MAAEKQIKIYFEHALSLVQQCGDVLREGYAKERNVVTQKGVFYDLVTEYDKRIEDLLIANLKEKFPETMFIGEEEAAASKRKIELSDEPTWIIDPIDGTTNFVNRIPHCCISVGMAIGKQLVLGIVYNPIANELYTACRGNGAYLNNKRIRVSACQEINNAILGFEVSMLHDVKLRDKYLKKIYKLAANAAGTRCFGAPALSLCYIAKGMFHAYHIEDLSPWDFAAGTVILREAGGVIYDSTGEEFNIMKPNLIAACTNELANKFLELIEQANQMPNCNFS